MHVKRKMITINDLQNTLPMQALNTRSQKEKTYHLMVSLRIEDEGKLTNEDFRAIEKRFAEALGLAEHQRHCGVHINTENMHIHVAYNLIHPVTYRRNEPFRDYQKRDALCRELEKEYGLSVDNGRDTNELDSGDNAHKYQASSRKKEVLTGEESFERYLVNRHKKIMAHLQQAKSWENVHSAFALYGAELKQRGNGLVIKNANGKQSIKASAFDRDISYKKLVSRFGSFQTPQMNTPSQEQYKKRPLCKEGVASLWQEFGTEYIKTRQRVDIEAVKEKWRAEKIRLTGLAISRKNQRDLLKRASLQERMEINKLRQSYTLSSHNWLEFLRDKAQNGNEEALHLLQNNQVKAPKESVSITAYGNFLERLKKNYEKQRQQNEIYSSLKSPQNKKTLVAVSFFKSVYHKAFTYSITRNGSIVFKLENGEKIIDQGNDVKYTANAKELAEEYMKEKLDLRQTQQKGLSR